MSGVADAPADLRVRAKVRRVIADTGVGRPERKRRPTHGLSIQAMSFPATEPDRRRRGRCRASL